MPWLATLLLLLVSGFGAALRAGQEDAPGKKPETDTFYSGTVSEFSDKQVEVLRTVLGKPEKHVFLIDATTKVEGKLRQKVRVTVKFEPSDAGDVAKLIRVRPAQTPPAPPKKK